MSVCTPCIVVSLSTTSANFNILPLKVVAIVMQDSWAKRGKTNKPTFLGFVRMTIVHRPKFLSKKEEDTFISQSVNFSQLVSSAKRFLSNQSSASTRSNASRQIHPGRRSDQLLSFTNTDKSWVTARIVFIGYGNLVWRHSPNTQSCDSAWTATSQSGVCKFEPKHDV